MFDSPINAVLLYFLAALFISIGIVSILIYREISKDQKQIAALKSENYINQKAYGKIAEHLQEASKDGHTSAINESIMSFREIMKLVEKIEKK